MLNYCGGISSSNTIRTYINWELCTMYLCCLVECGMGLCRCFQAWRWMCHFARTPKAKPGTIKMRPYGQEASMVGEYFVNLAQGNNLTKTPRTNCVFVLNHEEIINIPNYWTVTYALLAMDFSQQKPCTNRVHITCYKQGPSMGPCTHSDPYTGPCRTQITLDSQGLWWTIVWPS